MEVQEYVDIYKDIPNPAISRYSDTELFEESGVVFRNTYERKRLESSLEDKIIKVRAKEEGRLDLIAQRYYGNPKLYWLIAEVNYILDPINEVTVGRELRIPPQGNITV